MIPAAFEYVRALTTDEAFASLQQHGAEARVLAGGQSLIPAMRFRLARPGVLVDINSLTDLSQLRISDQVLAVGAIARDSDIERAPWIGERRWSLIRDASRVVADPVVRQMGTVVGSLCHNDPAGDWTAVALASRATVVVGSKAGARRVPIDDFLVDSFATAVGEGEMALGAEFPVLLGFENRVEHVAKQRLGLLELVTLVLHGDARSSVVLDNGSPSIE